VGFRPVGAGSVALAVGGTWVTCGCANGSPGVRWAGWEGLGGGVGCAVGWGVDRADLCRVVV